MTTPESRQTVRYERKREAILRSAVQLFNARGLHGTTLADVAQSVGLTTTSVTYYYRRKEDLAAACITRAIDDIDDIVETAQREATPEARLRRCVMLYFELQAQAASNKRPPIISFWDLRALTGASAEAALAAVSDLFRRFRALIKNETEPAPTHTEQNARTFLVFGSLLYAKEWVVRFEIDDYARCGEALADVLLFGLAGQNAGWTSIAAEPPIPRSPIVEISREAFLRAATELINEQGYRGASVDRISARLRVTKGSFYHHNETKDDLVAQCFDRSFEVIRSAHRAATRDQGNGWTRLCMIMVALMRYQRSENGPLLRHTALAAMPEVMRPNLVNELGRLACRTAGVIVDGIVDGSIRPVDPVIAAQFLAGVINAGAELHHWVRGISEEDAVALFVQPALLGVFSSER